MYHYVVRQRNRGISLLSLSLSEDQNISLAFSLCVSARVRVRVRVCVLFALPRLLSWAFRFDAAVRVCGHRSAPYVDMLERPTPLSPTFHPKKTRRPDILGS